MRAALPIVAIAHLAIGAGCVDGGVSGHACIVFDIRNTAQCGARQDVGGLSVVEVTSGKRTTTDDKGGFSIAFPDGATSAVLRVAGDRDDRRPTLVAVDAAAMDDVLTPVITTTLWNTYLTALHVPPEDPATAAVHVALSPLPGIAVGGVEIAGATQILYCQGEPFIWNEQPPGDQTPAIMAFGIPTAAGAAKVTVISRTDEVLFDAPVPVQPGAITWVRIAR